MPLVILVKNKYTPKQVTETLLMLVIIIGNNLTSQSYSCYFIHIDAKSQR